MRPAAFIYILLASLALTQTACSKKEGSNVRQQYYSGISSVVSVVSNDPPDSSLNVPVNSEIRLKFSGPVQVSSVDNISFRIEDESGSTVEGRLELNESDDEIIFKPMLNDMPSAFNSATTYTVRSEFIKDKNGTLIGPYGWTFRTKDFTADTTGKFRITEVYPHSWLMLPSNPITVEFSEPVYPGTPECNNSRWGDAFQVIVTDPSDPNGEFHLDPAAGNVCLICTYGVCDKLRFTPGLPGGSPQFWPEEAILLIRIKDTPDLKGISGEKLSNPTEYSKPEVKFVLFSIFGL